MNKKLLVLLCTLLPIGAVYSADFDGLSATAAEQSQEESARDVTQIRLERKLAEKEIAKADLDLERMRLEREGLNPEALKAKIADLEKQVVAANDRAVKAERQLADCRAVKSDKEAKAAPAAFAETVKLTRILVNGNIERARVLSQGVSREVVVGDEVETGVFVKAIGSDSIVLEKSGALKTLFLTVPSAVIVQPSVSTPFGAPPAAPVIH